MRTLSAILFWVVAVLLAGDIVMSVNMPGQSTALSAADDGPEIIFTSASEKIEAYDFLEVTLNVKKPTAKNPFTDVTVSGQFQRENEPAVSVEGFCDSADGGAYRIRFMPRNRANTRSPSPSGRRTSPKRIRASSRRSPANVAASCASIRTTPGTSSGRAPASITSSTATPPSF
jgi:hypothetical protein